VGEYVNIREITLLGPNPPDADQRRWRVAIDDGTIAAEIVVWMTDSEHKKLLVDEETWIREALRQEVAGISEPADQLVWLRDHSPIERPRVAT
jgi:hypothetical protein